MTFYHASCASVVYVVFVCLSVSLSVTHWYCVKMAKLRIMQIFTFRLDVDGAKLNHYLGYCPLNKTSCYSRLIARCCIALFPSEQG